MSIGIFKMCHKHSLKSAWLFTIGWRAFFICGKIKRTKEEMLLPQGCRSMAGKDGHDGCDRNTSYDLNSTHSAKGA